MVTQPGSRGASHNQAQGLGLGIKEEHAKILVSYRTDPFQKREEVPDMK